MLKQWLSVNMTSIAIMQLLMLLQLLTVIQQLLTMTRLLPLTPEVAASVVFKVQNHTVMFEYMGMEVEADMKQRKELVEAHKLLLLHRPNSLITACDKYMVLSKGTQKAIILIVGKDANTTDVFIFQDNTYNKTFPIDKPGLRVILLTSPVKVTRATMPQLTGNNGGRYKAYYFAILSVDVKLIESRNYLMMNKESNLQIDILQDNSYAKHWIAFKHLIKKDCPSTSHMDFPWVSGRDHDSVYPFFIGAVKRPMNNTTVRTRTYLTGSFEVYIKPNQRLVHNNTNSMSDCKNVVFESCPIFRFEISVFFMKTYCEYLLVVRKVGLVIYPCALSIKIIKHRGSYNITETVKMMVPFDYSKAYEETTSTYAMEENDLDGLAAADMYVFNMFGSGVVVVGGGGGNVGVYFMCFLLCLLVL